MGGHLKAAAKKMFTVEQSNGDGGVKNDGGEIMSGHVEDNNDGRNGGGRNGGGPTALLTDAVSAGSGDVSAGGGVAGLSLASASGEVTDSTSPSWAASFTLSVSLAASDSDLIRLTHKSRPCFTYKQRPNEPSVVVKKDFI